MEINYKKLKKGGIKSGVGLLAMVAGRGGVEVAADGISDVVDSMTGDEFADDSSSSAAPSAGAQANAGLDAEKFIKPPT